MDILYSNTTKKYFNEVMKYDDIVFAYKNNIFPDCYCMMVSEHDPHHCRFTESDIFNNVNS